MESIPEGEKARICLFYAKKQSPFTLQNLCAGTGWDHFSNFFLVVFNIWSSPFAGKRCAEQCVWGRVREREWWLMPCGPWCWYHFVPESSDPEWKAILFLSQMNHLPRHTLCPMVSPWPFSFPRLLCWVGTCLHITSQQPFGEETCFSYISWRFLHEFENLLRISSPLGAVQDVEGSLKSHQSQHKEKKGEKDGVW